DIRIEKYRHYVDTLTQQRIQTCDVILRQLDDTLELFNELQLQHQAVATKTKTLRDACDSLLMEKQRLIAFADALRSKLNYFDELENVHEAIRNSGGNKFSVSEAVEASIIYVRFKAAASELRGIVQQRISEFSKKEALSSLTRSGRAYLMQVF
ncbi:hypothetical protein KSS87_005669, partial [Heliosperma pusillum]